MGDHLEMLFRVRHYECDIYRHLNNANYLRYMQEVDALDEDPWASALLRRSEIEYVQPLSPGDEVLVRGLDTEQADGYQQRRYEFLASGDTVARARREWARSDQTDAGTAVPEPPPPPAGVFVQRRSVEWRDVDATAKVNPAAYAALAEDCGINVAAAHGWPMTRCSAAGFAIVLRRHDIEYGEPVGLDDELVISTWVSDPRRSMATRHYLLTRASDGATVARFNSLYVWVGLDTNRPVRIPPSFLEDFRPNFSG